MSDRWMWFSIATCDMQLQMPKPAPQGCQTCETGARKGPCATASQHCCCEPHRARARPQLGGTIVPDRPPQRPWARTRASAAGASVLSRLFFVGDRAEGDGNLRTSIEGALCSSGRYPFEVGCSSVCLRIGRQSLLCLAACSAPQAGVA